MTFEDNASFQDLCTLPKKIGDCRAYIQKWYYDSESQECESFNYGGCNGNENRFDTKRDCERQCNKSTRRSPGRSSGLNQEIFDELQQGCTKMGAHLLNHYRVDGEKRRSDVNVREIEREFDLVRCAIEN